MKLHSLFPAMEGSAVIEDIKSVNYLIVLEVLTFLEIFSNYIYIKIVIDSKVMQLIESDVEFWAQGQDGVHHVALCARICYASQRTDNDDQLVNRLMKNKHLSMFRHQTFYYHLPTGHKVPKEVATYLQHNSYCSVVSRGSGKQTSKEMFIVLNGQFALEHSRIASVIAPYMVSESDYIRSACALKSERLRKRALLNLRFTVCVTTQISTSRELNRKSPNNIAEQSTRYVNFGKRGCGICICKPAEFDDWSKWQRRRLKFAWWIAEKVYLSLVRHSMADKNFNKSKYLEPQHARGVLPLDTATKVVYTYSGREWKEIFDLRLRGTTGKPHPNAQEVCRKIRDEIMANVSLYNQQQVEL